MKDNPAHHDASLRALQADAAGRLDMRSRRDGDVHTIILTGEIDLANADYVRRELLGVEAGDARVIRIDLSGLTFVDSTAIRLLVLADTRSRANGQRLTLHGPSDAVLRVLRIAGLQDRLPLTT